MMLGELRKAKNEGNQVVVDSFMITAQINSWQRSTGKTENVSATSFRKAAVSAVHRDHIHLNNDLADLMSHNPKTSEKCYPIRQKRKNAAKISKITSKYLLMFAEPIQRCS